MRARLLISDLIEFLCLVVDVVAGFVLATGTGVCWPLFFRRPGAGTQKPNILRLIEGGGLEAITRKYGSSTPYLHHTIPGFTGLVVGSNLGSGHDFRAPLRQDYLFVETWSHPYLRFTSHLYFIAKHLAIVRNKNITIVHANSPYLAGFLGLIVAKLTGRPFCVSIHADYEKSEALQGAVIPRMFGSKKLSDWIEKVVCRRADLVLPIRTSMRSHLLEIGCPERKIRTFPHGIDLEPFEGMPRINMRRQFGIPEDGKIVSSVGRLEKENYSRDVLAISLRTANKVANVFFVICGDGSELEALRRQTKEHGLEDRVLFPGFVKHDLAIEVRRQSDVNLCLMGGFSLIEACAAGRPVISYDVEWHHELIQDGETGFLVPEGSVDEVVSKTCLLLADQELARRLGGQGRRRAFRRHSMKRTETVKAGIYMELLENHG